MLNPTHRPLQLSPRRSRSRYRLSRFEMLPTRLTLLLISWSWFGVSDCPAQQVDVVSQVDGTAQIEGTAQVEGGQSNEGAHVPGQGDFHRIEGKYVDIVTDLPPDEEIRNLPTVFEKAIPLWCQTFGVPLDEVQDWHGELFVMLDRNRFRSAGLIPAHLPEFPYGFQYRDQMWVSEQPSDYYRRHLVLHEGTHWFMHRLYGASGPPWVMEGMAEWLGTHRWDAATSSLEMAIIPASKDEVPYWGRISKIQQQLQQGSAPSLEAIMKYGNTAHRDVDAYAWSWAAVSFMKSHPDTRLAFDEMLQEPMRTDLTQTKWLFNRLRNKWPAIREQWRSYVSGLEYGFDPDAGLLQMTTEPKTLGQETVQFEINASQSWQASGWILKKGTRCVVHSKGEFVINETTKPWRSQADGVTLEYYNGQPIGRLMMAIAALQPTEKPTRPIVPVSIGSKREFVMPQDGELHFRINESTAELQNNQGGLTITLRPL